jgi:hypothetical protein
VTIKEQDNRQRNKKKKKLVLVEEIKKKKKKTITTIPRIVSRIFQGRPYNRFYKSTKDHAKSPIYIPAPQNLGTGISFVK